MQQAMTNKSYLNLSLICNNKRQVNEQFLSCLKYFFFANLPLSLFGTFLIIGIILANGILLIKTLNRKISIYDQVIIGHCIVNGLTGIVDVPFYLIYTLFTYWPFDKLTATLWVSYDNNINTTTNLHMLYMLYVTYKGIKVPSQFSHEVFIKKPYLVMLSFWLIGIVIWCPISFLFGVNDNQIDIRYNPPYAKTVINLFSWFIIDVLILIFSIYFYLYLSKKRKEFLLAKLADELFVNNLSNSSPFSPLRNKDPFLLTQFKFFLIVAFFFIQWTLPSFVTLIEPFVSNNYNSAIYWLTYTVCFTDPILIMFYNPNKTLHTRQTRLP